MKVVKALYLIPDPERCIENGAVAVKDAKIYRVGTFDEIRTLAEIDEVVDLGNAAILPGLINIHTHLDLTSLHNRIKPTNNFTHWVFQLLGARMRWKEAEYTASIEKGIRCCIESGTTTVADIANTAFSFPILKKSPLRKIVYKEVIDLDSGHAKDVVLNVQSELSAYESDDRFCTGLSPHAPYSVSKELYREIAQIVCQKRLPLCTHVAETRDEIEFLVSGSGNFSGFLRQLRALPANWQPPGLSPIHYLKETGILDARPVLIHCNYITDEEISLIHSSGASVAFLSQEPPVFWSQHLPTSKANGCGDQCWIGH